jgi:hypothetical protein
MAMDLNREAPGIYVATWSGFISIQDIIAELQKLNQMADEDGFEKYIYVLDLRNASSIPFDIRNLRRLAEEGSSRRYTVIVGASYGIHVLTKIVSRFTDYDIEFFDEVEEAVEFAHKAIKEQT